MIIQLVIPVLLAVVINLSLPFLYSSGWHVQIFLNASESSTPLLSCHLLSFLGLEHRHQFSSPVVHISKFQFCPVWEGSGVFQQGDCVIY